MSGSVLDFHPRMHHLDLHVAEGFVEELHGFTAPSIGPESSSDLVHGTEALQVAKQVSHGGQDAVVESWGTKNQGPGIQDLGNDVTAMVGFEVEDPVTDSLFRQTLAMARAIISVLCHMVS